jgi:hypothetical protein
VGGTKCSGKYKLVTAAGHLPGSQLNKPYLIQSFVSSRGPCAPSLAPAHALKKLAWIRNLQGLLVLCESTSLRVHYNILVPQYQYQYQYQYMQLCHWSGTVGSRGVGS